MQHTSPFKRSSKIITLAALATFNFGAYAAQEEKELQEALSIAASQDAPEIEAQAAPLMLAIRHRVHQFHANGPQDIVWLGRNGRPDPNPLPPTVHYGCEWQFRYRKQADDTYRHFAYSYWRNREELTEPTAYRYETSFDPQTNTAFIAFVSIEKGEAKPASNYDKPHPYVVQILPQTYYDEFAKYEKQPDNTYKMFSWSKENKEWVEDKHAVAWCNRVCEADGTLVKTQMEFSSKPAETPENPEDGDAQAPALGQEAQEETKEEHEQVMKALQLLELEESKN
jgi:hypothetical protein